MTAWDNSGMEHVPFDGRVTPLPTRRRRRQVPVAGNHGPDCSSNPEVGCVCGYDPGEDAPPDSEEFAGLGYSGAPYVRPVYGRSAGAAGEWAE